MYTSIDDTTRHRWSTLHVNVNNKPEVTPAQPYQPSLGKICKAEQKGTSLASLTHNIHLLIRQGDLYLRQQSHYKVFDVVISKNSTRSDH